MSITIKTGLVNNGDFHWDGATIEIPESVILRNIDKVVELTKLTLEHSADIKTLSEAVTEVFKVYVAEITNAVTEGFSKVSEYETKQTEETMAKMRLQADLDEKKADNDIRRQIEIETFRKGNK